MAAQFENSDVSLVAWLVAVAVMPFPMFSTLVANEIAALPSVLVVTVWKPR